MRSIFYGTIVILSLSTFAQAQEKEKATESKTKEDDRSIKKGTLFIGSFFNFSALNSTRDRVKGFDTETKNIKLGGNLTAGKMLSDHWGLMLNLGYNSTSSTSPQIVGLGNNATLYNLNSTQNDFIIVPGIRYYKLVAEDTYLFVQSAAQISFGTLNSDELDKNQNIVNYNFNTNGFGFGISPGISYFMTKKLSSEIAIGVVGFSVYDGKDSLGNKVHVTNVQSLFYQSSVSLGFVLYL